MIECNLYFERIRLVCQSLEKKKGELVFLASDNEDFVFNLRFVIHFDFFLTFCSKTPLSRFPLARDANPTPSSTASCGGKEHGPTWAPYNLNIFNFSVWLSP